MSQAASRTRPPGVLDIDGLVRTGAVGRLAELRIKVRRRLGLLHPFEVEDPTPPRLDPVRLDGSLWAVTAYFNPGDSPIHRRNYQRFRRRLKEQGVPLLTVELGFGDRPFDLGPDAADRRVQIRGGDVLWQKERLLNLGVKALPPDCDRVAWLDCDVLFDRKDWAVETHRLLESFVVVQPFLRRVRLPRDQDDADPDALPVGMGEAHVHYGVAYGVAAKGLGALKSYRRHGSTGFAWAARRALLDRHGLYDRLVLGGADKMMARAMYRGFDGVATRGFSPALSQHLSTWADAFFADVRGSVGYADTTVLHLWHGSGKARGYADRNAGLVDHSYDPEVDVDAAPGEALTWSGGNPALAEWVESYFSQRARAADDSQATAPAEPGSNSRA